MPSFLRAESFDEMFNASPVTPIIINDLPNRTEEDREYFNYLVRSTYTSDMITAMPRCFCGAKKGEHQVGKICEVCGKPVVQSIETDINPALWFRRPEGVAKLISPYFLILLRQNFNKRGINVIDWLMIKTMPTPSNPPPIIKKLIRDNVPRGYNAFVENFDYIVDYLIRSKEFARDKFVRKITEGMLDPSWHGIEPLQKLLLDRKDAVFSDYIPIPNKMFIILEKTDTTTYVESTIFDIQNVVNTMLSIDKDHYDTRPGAKENRTAKILQMLALYYEPYVLTRMRPKKGHYRKHVYGGRGNHSFRAVITSNEAITEHDEIWMPWGVGVTAFWLHLLNYLLSGKYGNFMHRTAVNFLLAHVEKYHPLIDHLLQKLIRDSPDGYIAIMQHRNPTLKRGSAQSVKGVKFKTDPSDKTVSMSDLIATAYNA